MNSLIFIMDIELGYALTRFSLDSIGLRLILACQSWHDEISWFYSPCVKSHSFYSKYEPLDSDHFVQDWPEVACIGVKIADGWIFSLV